MIPRRVQSSRARIAVPATIVLLLIAAAAFGEIVILRDGRRYQGNCRVAGNEVSCATETRTSFIPRAAVERIELSPAEKNEIDRLKGASLAGGANGFCAVGKWLDDHLQYEDADTYYNRALEADPDHAGARDALGFRREGKNWVPDPSKQIARAMLGFGDSASAACLRIAKDFAAKGQSKNAELALRRALMARPEQPEALKLIQPYLAEYKQKNAYRRPLDGNLLAAEGADHHLTAYMYNAIDFVKVNDGGKIAAGDGKSVEDYYTYGAPVLAAAAGEVIAVVDGKPDAPLGRPGSFLDANSVAIRHAGGEFTLYAHLKAGTISVHKGDSVKAGQILGKAGNSGSSTAPHLHFCLYDIDGISLPVRFTDEKPASTAP